MQWHLTAPIYKHKQLNAYSGRQKQTGPLHRVVCDSWRIMALRVIDPKQLALTLWTTEI